MSAYHTAIQEGSAPLNTEGKRKPATQRAGAFGLTGLLVAVRGKSTDKQPWGCTVIPMSVDTPADPPEVTIMDAVGDELKTRAAWVVADDGRTLEVHALRFPKQNGLCTACAVPLRLQMHVNAVSLSFSNPPKTIPAIGSIVECSNILVNCGKGFASWNCQDMRASAPHARLPAELAVAEAIPYGIPCLDLVGPSRLGEYSHTLAPLALPVHPSSDFPLEGLKHHGGISPVIRLDVNRHLTRDVVGDENALRQRLALLPEGLLLSDQELAQCQMQHVDAVTSISPKIWSRKTDGGGYGKFMGEVTLVSAIYGPDQERQQSISVVQRGIFAESYCANAGAGVHPPLWEAITLPSAPDLKDYLPIMPHHLLLVPDYEKSRTLTDNLAALTEYELECAAAMEAGKPKPDVPNMILSTARVLGYVPRVCQHMQRYGIPVTPQMVRRRFNATGAKPIDLYTANDLYCNGPSKKLSREAWIKAQTTATGSGIDPTKMMERELFERPWTFQHHVGWVVADWQPDMQWVEQILGEERRSADWLWYAQMLVKPESKMPFGSSPSASAEEGPAETRPLSGCTLHSPEEGDAWIEAELKDRYARMSEDKRRPFVGKHKNSAPLEQLADWRNIWMQTMADADAPYTLPIMAFIAIRANTKGMTSLGLNKKRGREEGGAAVRLPDQKKPKKEVSGDGQGEEEEEEEEGAISGAEDEMDQDPPPHASQ